jgi:hypothetical protein
LIVKGTVIDSTSGDIIKPVLEDQMKMLNLLLLFVLISCVYEESVSLTGNEEVESEDTKSFDSLRGAENFSFSMYRNELITIEVLDHNSAPYVGANFSVLDSKKRAIISAATGADGRFSTTHPLSTTNDNLYLVVEAVGITTDTIEFSPGYPVTVSAAVSSRSRTANSNGLPDSLAEDVYISSSLLSDINAAFPERSRVDVDHPEYIQQGAVSELITSDNSEVWITFIHEGAGYRNSFGYFTYGINETPASIDALDLIPVFPNSSFAGSGGSLQTDSTFDFQSLKQNRASKFT